MLTYADSSWEDLLGGKGRSVGGGACSSMRGKLRLDVPTLRWHRLRRRLRSRVAQVRARPPPQLWKKQSLLPSRGVHVTLTLLERVIRYPHVQCRPVDNVYWLDRRAS